MCYFLAKGVFESFGCDIYSLETDKNGVFINLLEINDKTVEKILDFLKSVKKFKDNIIEVNTTLKMVPNQEVKHKILGELTGASLVSIDSDFKITAEQFEANINEKTARNSLNR